MGTQNYIKKLFYFSYGNLINLLLGFITAPVLTRLFLPGEYGKQALFTTILNLSMTLALLGFDQAFARYFYKVPEDERPALTKKATSWTFRASFVCGLFVFLCGRRAIPQFLEGYDARIVLFLSLNIILGSFNRFLILVIRMQQHANRYSACQIMAKVVSFCSIVAFALLFKADIYAIIYGTTLSALSVSVYCVVVERSYWKRVVFYKASRSVISFPELLRYGLPFVPNAIMVWLMNSVDKLCLAAWAGAEQVGIYSAANTFIVLLALAQTSFSTFWHPMIYERYEKNPEDKTLFLKAYEMMSFTMLTAAFGLIFFRSELALLLGEKFRQAAEVMPFLIFMPVYSAISDVSAAGINIQGKSKYHLFSTGVTAGLNLLGNRLLVPLYGAVGAAAATGVSYIVFCFLRTFLSEKVLPVGYRRKRLFTATILLTCVSFCASFLKIHIVPYFTAAIGYAFVIFLYRKEAKQLLGIAKNLIGKKKAKEGTVC